MGHRGLRARWYNAGLGRFTNIDPFPGRLARPATRHPYVYGLNNPVAYTDPSGYVYDWAAGGAWVPPWAPKSPYLRTAYGYIDTAHYRAAQEQTQYILRQLREGGPLVLVEARTQYGFGYRAQYRMLRQCGSADMQSVALGIFEDFSVRFEQWQSRFFFGTQERWKASSFANEDLPSDYLGFYSVVTGADLSDIVLALGGAIAAETPRHPGPNQGGGPGRKELPVHPKGPGLRGMEQRAVAPRTAATAARNGRGWGVEVQHGP